MLAEVNDELRLAYISQTIAEFEIRKHLSDFLFRKSIEVETHVAYLSGGEKAGLFLAK